MQADSAIMRDAAEELRGQISKYNAAKANINTLITSTLGQYWADEAYDTAKERFVTKDKKTLEELENILNSIAAGLKDAADELDAKISKLKSKM